jgi:hypothetical protein
LHGWFVSKKCHSTLNVGGKHCIIEWLSIYPIAGQGRQRVKKNGIMFFDSTEVATSNIRKIEIPFVSVFSLYHLLGPTQCNKSRLLPNYNKQDVGPYMLFVNPMFK